FAGRPATFLRALDGDKTLLGAGATFRLPFAPSAPLEDSRALTFGVGGELVVLGHGAPQTVFVGALTGSFGGELCARGARAPRARRSSCSQHVWARPAARERMRPTFSASGRGASRSRAPISPIPIRPFPRT